MIRWRIDTPPAELPAEAQLTVRLTDEPRYTRVLLDGELHGSTTALLRAVVENSLRDATRDVVVDCRGLTFLAAAGAACLLQCSRMTTARGGRFRLAGLSGFHSSVLDALGLLDVLAPREPVHTSQ